MAIKKKTRGWSVFVPPVRHGTKWRCRWKGCYGSGSQSFLMMADAEDLRRKKTEEFERMDAGLPPKTPAPMILTVGQLAEDYLKEARVSKSKNTYENFDRPAVEAFRSFIGDDRRLVALTPHDGKEFKHRLMATRIDPSRPRVLGPTTVVMRFRQVVAMMNYAVRMKYIPESPFLGVKKPTSDEEGRDLTDNELDVLFQYPSVELYRAGVFAINTMLRLGEVLAFDFSWVMAVLPDGNWLAEVPRMVRKKKITAWIVLNEEARKAMGDRRQSGRVFPFNRRDLQRDVQRAREAGLLANDITFHCFRHTGASRYLKNGGHLEDLLNMKLWKDLRTVLRYVHVRPETVSPRFNASAWSHPGPKAKKEAGPSGTRRLPFSP